MTTLADSQRFLRQKRATGRLSDNEIEQAYKAWYGTEASRAEERAKIELQAKRDQAVKEQGASRLAQSNRQIQMKERAERDRRHATEAQGKLQLLKLAVPDLFMYEGGGRGGAQAGTTQAIGGQAIGTGVGRDDKVHGRAVGSLSEAPRGQEAASVASSFTEANQAFAPPKGGWGRVGAATKQGLKGGLVAGKPAEGAAAGLLRGLVGEVFNWGDAAYANYQANRDPGVISARNAALEAISAAEGGGYSVAEPGQSAAMLGEDQGAFTDHFAATMGEDQGAFAEQAAAEIGAEMDGGGWGY